MLHSLWGSAIGFAVICGWMVIVLAGLLIGWWWSARQLDRANFRTTFFKPAWETHHRQTQVVIAWLIATATIGLVSASLWLGYGGRLVAHDIGFWNPQDQQWVYQSSQVFYAFFGGMLWCLYLTGISFLAHGTTRTILVVIWGHLFVLTMATVFVFAGVWSVAMDHATQVANLNPGSPGTVAALVWPR